MLRLTVDECFLQLIARRPVTLRCLHSKSVGGVLDHDEQLANVRQWLANLRADTIPRNICNVSFSRSSGPGGQNVNKVNSKATLRVPLHSLLQVVPSALHQGLRSSRFHAAGSDAIVIQADGSRKQSENVQECFCKLQSLVAEAGRAVVPGETTAGQKEYVQRLKKAENEARIRAKKVHSSKKASRRDGRGDY
ncbi:MAG: hypothetical protein M1840_007640 [Geoglossum simile]|nr:MAG: hypothetical protein M1840_007640 [Geoglossum simile]